MVGWTRSTQAFCIRRLAENNSPAALAELGELKFVQRHTIHLIGANTRRVGDHVWGRVNEVIMPNFPQAEAAYATDGTKIRYHGRSAFSRWIVAINDTETQIFGWANFGDPPQWNTPDGIQMIEQGEVFDRPYEERQKFPADAEACEGMGSLSVHRNEHWVPTDKGVMLLRNTLRAEIRALQQGRYPEQPSELKSNPIPTYGGDTVLRLPPSHGGDDRSALRALGSKVIQLQFDADCLTCEARDATILARMKEIETFG